VIVVVGLPRLHRAHAAVAGADAAGLAVAIARAAVAGGAAVQLVGKVGDDPEGDAIVLDLARSAIGHPAMLRDPARRTPIGGRTDADRGPAPTLEPADLELALRYVPDFGVLILAAPSLPKLTPVAIDAAGFAGAQLIVLTGTRSEQLPVPESATLVAAPVRGGEGAFAALVGAYAVALDAGVESAAAWRAASDRLGMDPRA
jgi:hypothetical protein